MTQSVEYFDDQVIHTALVDYLAGESAGTRGVPLEQLVTIYEGMGFTRIS